MRYGLIALHDLMDFDNPALRTLVPTITAAYVFQIVVAIPAIIYEEDRFFGTNRLRCHSDHRLLGIFNLSGLHYFIFIPARSSREVYSLESRSSVARVSSAHVLSPSTAYYKRFNSIVDGKTWFFIPHVELIQVSFYFNVFSNLGATRALGD